jgi:hypothetical protein
VGYEGSILRGRGAGKRGRVAGIRGENGIGGKDSPFVGSSALLCQPLYFLLSRYICIFLLKEWRDGSGGGGEKGDNKNG